MIQKRTIEQQVADVILQRDVDEITIDEVSYKVGMPSVATLILVSEVVSTLPVMEAVEAKEDMLNAVLRSARHYRAIGDIAAILILGAKNLTEDVVETETRSCLFGLLKLRKKVVRTIDRKTELAEKILENVSSKQLFELIVKRLNRLEIGDFFVITTSLSEANILKPTKEVVQ